MGTWRALLAFDVMGIGTWNAARPTQSLERATHPVGRQERICSAFSGTPLMVNVVEGGKTPVLPKERYIEMGYQLAIYPATAFLAAGRGIETVYAHLKTTGSSVGVEVRRRRTPPICTRPTSHSALSDNGLRRA